MDAGRQWVLENLGTYGPRIREVVADAVRVEHAASVEAQDASGHRSKGVYGEFWRGMLERLKPLGDFPGVSLERPGAATYRVPVVNGFAVFPWRFARSRRTRLDETPFATSPSRSSLLELPAPRHEQSALDLNVPDAGLTEDDRQVLDHYQSIITAKEPSATRLLLVAISSSSSGLFSAEWGEVHATAGGCLGWVQDGFREDLRAVPSAPVSTTPARTFTSGALPTVSVEPRKASGGS